MGLAVPQLLQRGGVRFRGRSPDAATFQVHARPLLPDRAGTCLTADRIRLGVVLHLSQYNGFAIYRF